MMSFLLMCAALSAPGDGTLDVSVMSFNVRYGTAQDEENSWVHRSELLIETIEKYDPDLLGVQECLDFQAEYIAEALPKYGWFGIGRDRDGGGEQTAVFYKKNEFVPVHIGNFWLSDKPNTPGSVGWDAAITRMATWVRFHHPRSGRFLFFANTHFDHKGEFARAASAQLIGEKVNELAGNTPIVVTGDFNAVAENSDPWNALIASGLQDTWVEANETKGPEYTFGGFRPLEPDRKGRIDWIFTSPEFEVDLCETVAHNADGRFPSDHFPIYAEIRLPGATLPASE